jgi:CBS-domain-containing membrane protein
MIAAGLVEVAIGVEAAGRGLEDIAQPLSAQEAEQDLDGQDSWTIGRGERFIPNLRTGLTGRQVHDAMVPDPVTVPADLPLERLVSDVFLVRQHGVYPVRNDAGEVIGIISMEDVIERSPPLGRGPARSDT